MSFGAIVPVLIAAARRKREEEDMSGYSKDDMGGWEFKIVRSPSGRFNSYERVQELCKEEGKAGWELMEKLDEYRIRFKRRIEKRSGDSHLSTDPYRTRVGLSEFALAMCIISIIFAIIAAAIIIVGISKSDVKGFELPILIPIILIVIGISAAIFIRLKR